MSAKVGCFMSGTGAVATTVSETGLGFEPVVVFLFWNADHVTNCNDQDARDHIAQGWGFMNDTEEYSACWASQDAALQEYGHICNDAGTPEVFKWYSYGGALQGSMKFDSMDADGFTLEVTNQLPTSIPIQYLALSANVVEDSFADQVNTKAGGATGNQAYTGTGFQPDLLIFISGALYSSTIGDRAIGFGAASDVGEEACISTYHQDGSNSNGMGYFYDGECMGSTRDGANTTDIKMRAELVSFDADGFTLNFLENDDGSIEFTYIALKGGPFYAGAFEGDGTLNDLAVTGLGFAPVGALFFGNNQAICVQDTPVQYQLNMHLAAADNDPAGINQIQNASYRRIQFTPEICWNDLINDHIYQNLGLAGPASGEFAIKTFDPDGFTVEQQEASSTGMMFVAFGSSAGWVNTWIF
jgi:hypothetical protein